MTDIYTRHRAAFAQVEAYVILRDGERVATIAFKFPRDGASRLYAYVHWLGLEMVRGHAAGGGYDKRSAACGMAARRLAGVSLNGEQEDETHPFRHFYRALNNAEKSGAGWDRALRDAGFTMLQAV